MTWEIHTGDCIEQMAQMEERSVDAVVCDPPYGLSFMGQAWDTFDPSDLEKRVGTREGTGPASDVHDGRSKGRSKSAFANGGGAAGSYDLSLTANQRYQAWCEAWAKQAFRILKPGGHLLASCGTRTYHRLAAGVEDAGFEIRDSLLWLYGSGFAKSWNFDTRYEGEWCQCKPLPYSHASDPDVHGVRSEVPAPSEPCGEGEGADLLPEMQRDKPGEGLGEARSQGPSGVVGGDGGELSPEDPGRGQPVLEGRELHRRQGVSPGSDAGSPKGPAERVCAGARSGGSGEVGAAAQAGRGGPPQEPGSAGQSAGEPEGVHLPSGTLADGASGRRGRCEGCGGLRQEFHGFSTALKPAHEPIVVARKPLIGTVAENVLEHGTGGINVDGCRIEGPGWVRPNGDAGAGFKTGKFLGDAGRGEPTQTEGVRESTAGRWPANVVLSHLEECESVGVRVSEWNCAPGCPVAELDAQSGVLKSGALLPHHSDGGKTAGIYGEFSGHRGPSQNFGGDSGGASRFFYCAKTSRAEREAGLDGFDLRTADPYGQHRGGRMEDKSRIDGSPAKEGRNHHPTVKPINLMRWLCRLVTPPGGTILDPFLGSGSTGCAAVLEGFGFTGIEREAEYVEIAKARIEFWAQHEGREVEEVLGLHAVSQREAKAHAEVGQISIEEAISEAAA